MATAAERQRKFKAQMAEQGLTQASGWVHEHQASALAIAIRLLRDNPDLEIGPLRNTTTGRLVRAR